MKRLALIMALVAMVAATPASAQTPAGDAYGQRGGDVLGTVDAGNGDGGSGNGTGVEGVSAQGGTSSPAPQQQVTTSSGTSLPFTGLDIGLLVIGGMALVGVGIGLRRFARPMS